jgi:hypothetical protein
MRGRGQHAAKALAPERPGHDTERFMNERVERSSLASSPGIAVESIDRSFSFYRVRGAKLERIQDHERGWTELSLQDIRQHLVLRTPVAIWLGGRIALRPVDWVKTYLHVG